MHIELSQHRLNVSKAGLRLQKDIEEYINLYKILLKKLDRYGDLNTEDVHSNLSGRLKRNLITNASEFTNSLELIQDELDTLKRKLIDL